MTPTPVGGSVPVDSHATLTELMLSPNTPDLIPAAVRDGPATSKLVYLALDDHGSATVDTLQATTGQSRRAVVEALGDLEDKNLVTARPDEYDDTTPLNVSLSPGTYTASGRGEHTGSSSKISSRVRIFTQYGKSGPSK